MDKEIQEFKDKVMQISIPDGKLNIAINEAILQAEKRKKKRYVKSFYKIAIVALLFLTLIGSAYVSPVMARVLNQVPLLGSVLTYYDIGLQEAADQDLIVSVGDTFSDRDITITITDIYYDDFRLVVGYSVPFKKGIDTSFMDTKVKLYIGNKQVTGVKSDINIEGDKLIGKIETKAALPKTFNLELAFTEVLDKTGNWNFQIPVSKVDSGIVYAIDKIAKDEAYQFELINISLTPSGTKLQMKLDTPVEKEGGYSFLLITDNGKELNLIDEDSSTIHLNQFHKDVVKKNALYEPIKDKSKVKIIPVFHDLDGNVKQMLDLTIDVDLSKIKGMEITDDSPHYGLVEDKQDRETYLQNEMLNEISDELNIELGEYTKAELTVLDLGFAIEFQKEHDTNFENVVKPIALIQEKIKNNAYLVYKTENGENHVFEAEKIGETWQITDSYVMKGATIDELNKKYK
ncbi:DUF4179 domain-containing protein [Bacillaceae bacterium Marseille-Q3522]|nr:DUF4179 domain-containing protein [Bacillaceae bacterium Marseille-Q3522]